MQQRDTLLRAKARKGGSSFSASRPPPARRLDRPLAPGPSAPRPKPPANPLTPANRLRALCGFPIQHGHAGVRQDLTDLVRLAGFVVVISKDRDHRDFHGASDLARQDPRLIWKAVVGEVATQQQDVGRGADLSE